MKAVKAGVGHLGRYPEAGRPTTLSEGAMREAVVSFGRGGYVVLYRADGDAIYLLSVRHGREAGY